MSTYPCISEDKTVTVLQSEGAGWPENVEHMQTSPFPGFMWLSFQWFMRQKYILALNLSSISTDPMVIKSKVLWIQGLMDPGVNRLLAVLRFSLIKSRE